MAYQDGRGKRAVWNHEARMAFINAIREGLGKEPIPYSQKQRARYSGLTIYGVESRRVGTTESGSAAYEPLS